jgi:UrcA family protein
MRNQMLTVASAVIFSAVIGTVTAQTTPEVVVTSSRVVATQTGQMPGGTPIEKVSLSYTVSAKDLDLTSKNGKAELEKRVSDAASKACNQIQQQFPETTPSVAECTRQAKAAAMAKVQQIEAAAGKTQ